MSNRIAEALEEIAEILSDLAYCDTAEERRARRDKRDENARRMQPCNDFSDDLDFDEDDLDDDGTFD